MKWDAGLVRGFPFHLVADGCRRAAGAAKDRNKNGH